MVKCFLKITAALLFVTGFNQCQAIKHSASHLRKEITATTTSRAIRRIPQKSPMNERDLRNSNFTYRANYTAQFHSLRDNFCIDPNPPVIQVLCHGPNIQLLNTSDQSIVCSRVDDAFDGWSTIECNNTCASDTACQDVYLNIGGTGIADGPYGEIRFQCEGDDLVSIDSAVFFLGGDGAGCGASTTHNYTRNFHAVRMGVSCRTESGGRAYVFDDYYFDCYGGWPYPTDTHPGDEFTCYNGHNCGGAACDVVFDDLHVEADPLTFLDACVETSVIFTPTPAPVLNTTQNQLFNFSAKFEAAWRWLSDPVDSTCYDNTAPTIQLTCLNSNITFVNSTYETVDCKTVSSGVLECTDNITNFVDNFTGVVYVSGDFGL
jgi:hypothetical protein